MKPILLPDLTWFKSNRHPSRDWARAICFLLFTTLFVLADSKSLSSASRAMTVTGRFDPGDLIFTDSAAALMKYNPRTGLTTPILSQGLLVQPYGIAIGEDQTVYISDTGAMGIIAIHRGAGKARLWASGATLGTPFGIASGLGHELYIANGQAVLAADRGSGKLRTTAHGGFLRAPLGVAVTTDGELFVADASGAVVQVHPNSGEQKLISSGSYLKNPVGITSSGSDELYVSDSSASRIVRVNAKTGEQALVATEGEMVTPVGVLVVGTDNLLVGDPDAFALAGGIIQVDLRSGFPAQWDPKLGIHVT